ncbi:SDR family NAD(P)-dependent oxidoreductase [Streptomyces mirabilis]|uniref:SDR family NAD(P)-dependent oxidoreductase n=1 Tax=Streptomyces mirabilis TaxID=68239 RepID=UPI00365FC25F
MSEDRKVVVVSGAAHGLGEAFAKAYRERVRRAVSNGHSIKSSDDLGCVTVAGAVGEPEVASRIAVEVVLERFGQVNALINDESMWRPGLIAEIPEDLYWRVMAPNLDGAFFGAQVAVPAMQRLPRTHATRRWGNAS